MFYNIVNTLTGELMITLCASHLEDRELASHYKAVLVQGDVHDTCSDCTADEDAYLDHVERYHTGH